MKHIVYGLIIAFLLILLFRSECGKPKVKDVIKVNGQKVKVIEHTIDTQYVPVKVKGRTDTLIEDTTIYVEVPVMDTNAMRKYLEDYYTKKVFNDTFRINYGKIYVQDTVQMNKIIGRTFGADLLVPVVKEYLTVEKLPKTELYLGVRTDWQKNGTFVGIGPSLLLKTKRQRIYGVGVNLVNGKPIYNIQMNIKL
jgi:hypothetical protein